MIPLIQTPVIQAPIQAPTKPLLRSPDAARLGDLVQAQPLTIDDAVTIALLTNRDFARSLASLEQARGRTSEARAGLNPTVGVNGTIDYYSAPINANFGGAAIPIQKQFVGIYNAGVTLPIDISGSIRAAVGQAQFNEIAARIDVNRVRNSLVFNVRNAFYSALRAQGTLVVAQETLANTQARLQDARASLAAGTGTQFDVLTAQRDVADAQGNLVNARGGVTLALAQLKNVMGIDVSTSIQIVDTGAVEDPGNEAPTAIAQSPNEDLHSAKDQVPLGTEYQASIDEAVRTRPEILEGNAAVSAARRGVTFARRSQLPSLAVSANYNVQPNFAGFTPANQGTLGLTFSVPIYDGGVARARVRQAEAVVAQAEVDRRTSIDTVTLEVQQAYVNEVQARERVRVANLAVQQAREAFRLARLRSQAGVSAGPQQSPQIELSNAQVSLTQAETNRVNALYDYNVARSALQRATGRYSYGGGGGFTQPPTEKETGTATPTQP
jgi:OMF family outer membrane factor